MIDKAPAQKSSVYAAEGTAAHKLAERCLESSKNSAADFLGIMIDGFEVTEEMAEAVQMYVDDIWQNMGDKKKLFVEERFDLGWLYPGLFGTNDACIVEPFGHIIVYDFKYGAGVPVNVTENKQLMYYALGAAYNFDPATITIKIIQPRAAHDDGPIREWTVDSDRITKQWAGELKLAAQTVNGGHLEAGKWCRWCPAFAMCPKAEEKALEEAKKHFRNNPLESTETTVLPDPETSP